MTSYFADIAALEARYITFQGLSLAAKQTELLTTLWNDIITWRTDFYAGSVSYEDVFAYVQTWVRMARYQDVQKYPTGVLNKNYGVYKYGDLWNEAIMLKEPGSGSPREIQIIAAITDITS